MTDVLDEPRPTEDSSQIPVRLRTIKDFGSNPGNLGMRLRVPEGAPHERPLVVALHGCSQTADGYDLASGWSRLASDHGFMLVYPEQRSGNNRDLCFSWFERDDTCRGRGEVESIRQMIGFAVERCGVDRRRIFVCGLSAGGAMAGAMLATYPELFAGGAIIAGLPYGTASNLHEAYESMSSGRVREAKVWGDMVREASPHRGPWPSVAVWHGSADKVVRPINAGEIVKQWTNVHNLGATVPAEDHIGRTIRRIWRDDIGRACITDYSLADLGHGVPVADSDPPAPFFLPSGISSTRQIASDWGLVDPPGESTLPGALNPMRHRLLSLLGL